MMGGVIGLTETLGYIAVNLSIEKLPRKKSLICSYVLEILICTSFIFFGFSSEATKTTCSFCEKCKIRFIINSRNYNIIDCWFNKICIVFWIWYLGYIC
jgi:hypothetical protein